jgi:hypothetical protein
MKMPIYAPLAGGSHVDHGPVIRTELHPSEQFRGAFALRLFLNPDPNPPISEQMTSSITVDLDRERLLELREQIDQLLG